MAQPIRHLSRFFTKAFYRLLLLIMTGLAFTPASALENDAQQPISVLAQNAEFNPDQGTAIYTGKVEIEQGSLRVKAHKVTVYRRSDGEIDKIIAEGLNDRVYLQQQPKPEDPIVKAYAMKIDYLASQQQVELTHQAELENGQDSFSGERIRYHLQSKRIQAWGQNKTQNEQSTDGRVKIILFPGEGEQAQ
ncbi:lipopolysaccharide transport periplasmic protein LptA [Oceanospirillum linum]|uniref:Lipopolysaccharide export system protein LptA n=1 Tax=Oceanospirillum linum TaxID=966 RepID=A0A1T1H9F9_OCELI|nr:lipopolysaccharide transport periplasmic protein LptA [Oceanospirillum linum]OOV86483.1 lipopolysaccharide transport periplasmic protein LptA [Oceanospirillum linum]SEG34723.1 lipopolysaccharide export system protein LptA [Oleiphilus messinensis]SMP29546.1 lipopolysaccharide export system protein LptA [Oceanospirillum linum]